MKTVATLTLAAIALTPAFLQEPAPLDGAALKKTIDGLGYETRTLTTESGREKFEFMIKTTQFEVPVAAEILPNKNYVWLSAFLGSVRADRHAALLQANNVFQPSIFYINDKGKLMMGVSVDNRGITPAILKRVTEQLAADVEKSSPVWQID